MVEQNIESAGKWSSYSKVKFFGHHWIIFWGGRVSQKRKWISRMWWVC